MKANFQKALKAVLIHEGGYVNDKRDPGGETNKGITKKVYDAYRIGRGEKPRSVRLIDNAELTDLYRRNYWDAVQGDDMPAGIDYVLFDGAVNSGPGQSIKWLQRALPGYTGAVDGIMGVRTLAQVKEDDNHDALIARICDRRMAFLRALRTWSVFGNGWTKRVAGVKAMGQAMASGKAPPKVALLQSAGGAERAPEADASAPPSKAVGDAAIGGGLTLGGTGGTGLGVVKETASQLEPFAGVSSTLTTIFVGLIVIGAAIALGGMGWRIYAVWRARKVAEAVN